MASISAIGPPPMPAPPSPRPSATASRSGPARSRSPWRPRTPLRPRLSLCSSSSSSSSSSSGGSGPSCSGRARGLRRREVLVPSTAGTLVGVLWSVSRDRVALASDFADMPAIRGKDYGKSKMRYPDYTETDSGLQYKDLRVGDGPTPKMGETVVVDWDGYTIGYYGRIFEARNKTKGGSFEGNDKDFFKFKIGSQEVIPAFEEAVAGMALGGVRSNAGS
ncbi:hypothetical protein EUGRSUZ_G01979 [Eucalyptus grandis]|uniref:Uncharacterized protein n=2 Tax=Eucalyptus grandis TaxID=71139 RepID=A0ACC3K4U4_EUCGR|nr:hypothetical protein EUGRSUZ_G01979 [Eucalyptus grandis]